jgi:hypothetical protein
LLQLSAALVAPAAPGTLTALVAGARVTLSWTPPSAGDLPTSYVVEAGSASGRSDLANFDTGNPTPALVADGVPAGTYFVRVRAKNGAGASGPSNEVVVAVTGGGVCAPGAPTGLTASSSGSTVTLAWTAPGGACAPTGYIIEAGSSPGLANLANFNTGSSATTFGASGVGAGTYYLRVRASAPGGTSAPSNEATLVVGGGGGCAGVPAATSLTGSVNGSTVSLAWTSVAGATSYVLEAGSAPGLSNLLVSDQGAATSLSAVAGNGTYYIRLRAKNACGASAPSNEIALNVGQTQGCTFEVTPTSQSVTAAGGLLSSTVTTAPTCAWTAVSNAAFITITSAASGTGNGAVSYSVAANTGAARTGTLTFAGQTITVTQAGATTTTCSFNVSLPGTVDAIGGMASVSVAASAPTCGWTAVSNAPFIAVTTTSSGTGTGSVTLNVDANGGPAARSGTVTIAGQAVSVSQTAPTPPLTRNTGCPSQVQTAPTPIQIKFVNATAGNVTVFRPGAGGERNDQRTLNPRTGFAQTTTTGAIWQVASGSNDCLASFAASVAGGYGVVP